MSNTALLSLLFLFSPNIPTRQVNQYLQVEGQPSMFALGDCCNTSEHKMAAYATKHANLVAANIVRVAGGGSPSPYKTVI